MSWIPAASTTARTAPPAMTPVPWEAGFSSTRLAEYCSRTSCGIVVPTMGILMTCFFASSTPLRIASGTSPALPRPTPTCPCPSPTTTTAEKLNRRPPLWTFATRLIWTTRSSSASLFGSMRATGVLSEVEAGFARRLGERANPPVIPVARTVEHDLSDTGGLRPLGQELADGGGAVALGPVRAAETALQRRGRGERPAGRVVD